MPRHGGLSWQQTESRTLPQENHHHRHHLHHEAEAASSIHLASFNFSRLARLLNPTRHCYGNGQAGEAEGNAEGTGAGISQINRTVTIQALLTNDEGDAMREQGWGGGNVADTHVRLVLSLVKPVNVKFPSLWCLLVHKLTGRSSSSSSAVRTT